MALFSWQTRTTLTVVTSRGRVRRPAAEDYYAYRFDCEIDGADVVDDLPPMLHMKLEVALKKRSLERIEARRGVRAPRAPRWCCVSTHVDRGLARSLARSLTISFFVVFAPAARRGARRPPPLRPRWAGGVEPNTHIYTATIVRSRCAGRSRGRGGQWMCMMCIYIGIGFCLCPYATE